MKHLKKYKTYQCTTCKGTGEVKKEINMWGEMGKVECDECDGTGKSSRQSFTKDLTSFTDESESELKSLLDKYEIRHGFALTNVERYSDNHEDVKSIEMMANIYSTSTLSKEFLEEINEMYVDYNIYFDVYGNLRLKVYKPY